MVVKYVSTICLITVSHNISVVSWMNQQMIRINKTCRIHTDSWYKKCWL